MSSTLVGRRMFFVTQSLLTVRSATAFITTINAEMITDVNR